MHLVARIGAAQMGEPGAGDPEAGRFGMIDRRQQPLLASI